MNLNCNVRHSSFSSPELSDSPSSSDSDPWIHYHIDSLPTYKLKKLNPDLLRAPLQFIDHFNEQLVKRFEVLAVCDGLISAVEEDPSSLVLRTRLKAKLALLKSQHSKQSNSSMQRLQRMAEELWSLCFHERRKKRPSAAGEVARHCLVPDLKAGRWTSSQERAEECIELFNKVNRRETQTYERACAALEQAVESANSSDQR